MSDLVSGYKCNCRPFAPCDMILELSGSVFIHCDGFTGSLILSLPTAQFEGPK